MNFTGRDLPGFNTVPVPNETSLKDFGHRSCRESTKTVGLEMVTVRMSYMSSVRVRNLVIYKTKIFVTGILRLIYVCFQWTLLGCFFTGHNLSSYIRKCKKVIYTHVSRYRW